MGQPRHNQDESPLAESLAKKLVDLATRLTDSGIGVAWQQSQPDFSQPLVGHWLPMAQVAAILS